MSEPFPFDPNQDSLLGEVLLEVWTHLGGSRPDLEFAYKEALGTSSQSFFFTPNSEKQILLSTIPGTIRNHLQNNEQDSVVQLIGNLARGSGSYCRASLDVAMELALWIFTGFDEEKLLRNVLKEFLSGEKVVSFLDSEDLIQRLQAGYDKKMREV